MQLWLRRLVRVAHWLALVLGVLVAGVAAWALFWTYYDPAVTLGEPIFVSRPAPEGTEITLVLGGDFAPTDAAMPLIRARGYQYPYLATAGILASADVAFANLEAPVTDSNDAFPLWKKYIYKVAPEATRAWQWLGLDVVSLANNHVSDYRDRGVRDTVRHLDAAGIAHVGAGTTESEARRPVIVDVGGTKIGFLAYLEDKPLYNLYLRAYAVGDRVGSARALRGDLAEDIRRLRPLVDVLVVSLHWGENYQAVTGAQEALGRWLVDQGVDVVAGHHPHDVQPVEVRGHGVILYSLGNYAWGAPGHGHLRVGFLARVRVSQRSGDQAGRVVGVELVPIATQNRLVQYQPRPLVAGELAWLDPFLAAAATRAAQVQVEGTIVKVAVPAPAAVPASALH